MKPGDPFETQLWDERRAAQRRILRLVDDDHVIAPFAVRGYPGEPLAPAFDATDAPLLEEFLRDHADELLQEIHAADDGLLSAMAVHMREIAALKFLDGRVGDGPTRARVMRDLHKHLEQTRFVPGYQTDDDIASLLLRLICALVWADVAADDGYADPRVAGILATNG